VLTIQAYKKTVCLKLSTSLIVRHGVTQFMKYSRSHTVCDTCEPCIYILLFQEQGNRLMQLVLWCHFGRNPHES